MMKTRIAAACAAGLLLSACGGSGGSGDDITFRDLQDRIIDFEDATGTNDFDEDLEPTAAGDLPPGTASYTGVAVGGREDVDADEVAFAAIGAADLEVDFAAGRVTGTADNFFEVLNPNLDSDDFNDAIGRSIEGSAEFTLTRSAGSAIAFEGTSSGDFTTRAGDEVSIVVPAGGAAAGDDGEFFVIEGFNESGEFLSVFAAQD